jgi:hypothetical protein
MTPFIIIDVIVGRMPCVLKTMLKTEEEEEQDLHCYGQAELHNDCRDYTLRGVCNMAQGRCSKTNKQQTHDTPNKVTLRETCETLHLVLQVLQACALGIGVHANLLRSIAHENALPYHHLCMLYIAFDA